MSRSLFMLSSLGATLFALAPLAYARNEYLWMPPKVVVVKMIDKSATEFTFEPSQVSVHPGDVLRFVQTSATPHNVEFREVPAGADLGATKTSQYLTAPDQKLEIQIDKHFVTGTYRFVCIPHEAMGMKGSLTITTS